MAKSRSYLSNQYVPSHGTCGTDPPPTPVSDGIGRDELDPLDKSATIESCDRDSAHRFVRAG